MTERKRRELRAAHTWATDFLRGAGKVIKFRSELFRTQRERAAAVAYAYLTADGINSDDVITEALNHSTDSQLAADTTLTSPAIWARP